MEAGRPVLPPPRPNDLPFGLQNTRLLIMVLKWLIMSTPKLADKDPHGYQCISYLKNETLQHRVSWGLLKLTVFPQD